MPKLTGLRQIISTRNIGTSFLLGAFVLLVATYGAYQLQRLLSPNTGTSGDTATVRIQLKVSDRSCNPKTNNNQTPCPLNRGLQPPSTDVPYYDYEPTTDGPTVLPNNTTFRIQGEVYYKDK